MLTLTYKLTIKIIFCLILVKIVSNIRKIKLVYLTKFFNSLLCKQNLRKMLQDLIVTSPVLLICEKSKNCCLVS